MSASFFRSANKGVSEISLLALLPLKVQGKRTYPAALGKKWGCPRGQLHPANNGQWECM
jgi:hypothetical protein